MKAIFTSVLLSIFVLSPALAQNQNGQGQNGQGQNGQGQNGQGQNGQGGALGAPAPLLGAGLPGLGIAVGYGAYWLARRRRKNAA